MSAEDNPQKLPAEESLDSTAPASVSPAVPKKSRTRWWVRGLILFFILALFGVLALPNFIKARTSGCLNSCIANLKQIDGAAQQWALENHKTDADKVDPAGVVTYLKGGVMPTCPAGGSYTMALNVSSPPTCTLAGTLGHSLP